MLCSLRLLSGAGWNARPGPRLVFGLLVLALVASACGDADEPAGDGLVRSAAAGDAAAVRRALDAGTDVDTRDPRGRTAVTAAAAAEHADVVRLLVDAGADVDLQDDTRTNALLVCGEKGNVAVLREVLRARPDLARTNRFGGTALIPAADRGHVEMVRALLETEIDVDHVNRLGWTALLEAVILGDGGDAHQRIVDLLVDAGADVGIADREGVTPLEHARDKGYDEIARSLERADARG